LGVTQHPAQWLYQSALLCALLHLLRRLNGWLSYRCRLVHFMLHHDTACSCKPGSHILPAAAARYPPKRCAVIASTVCGVCTACRASLPLWTCVRWSSASWASGAQSTTSTSTSQRQSATAVTVMVRQAHRFQVAGFAVSKHDYWSDSAYQQLPVCGLH
jgi:hypothetical protein